MIDKFDLKSGFATSIKSLDLRASTYQNTGRLKSVVKRYIDKVSKFNGSRWSGREIDKFEIKERALDLVVPNMGTKAQKSILKDLERYALEKNIHLNIKVFK